MVSFNFAKGPENDSDNFSCKSKSTFFEGVGSSSKSSSVFRSIFAYMRRKFCLFSVNPVGKKSGKKRWIKVVNIQKYLLSR